MPARKHDGLHLAATAIDDAARLRSTMHREVHLPSLAPALDARPGDNAQELARLQRDVARDFRQYRVHILDQPLAAKLREPAADIQASRA